MFVLGVDACRTGWIAVATGDVDPEAHYLPTIDALGPLATGAHSVAIDIPIGLPTSGTREADLLARSFVGPRRSSVFLTPVREAFEAETYAVATAAALARTGTGISHQAYALGKKILEVERWLPSSPCPVYEVHPEVSFAVLLGAPAKASKKTWAGMVERWQALQADGICLGPHRWRRGRPGFGRRHPGRRRRRLDSRPDCAWGGPILPRFASVRFLGQTSRDLGVIG